LRQPRRYFCELDRWSFDPRYTGGRCPICGWAPTGAPTAPGWLMVARRFDWQLFGLLALAILLVLVGLIVAEASGFSPPSTHIQSPNVIASGARTASGSR
jgi:hypothetical protein